MSDMKQCPKCDLEWLEPCEQTICIDLHGECIKCRYVTNQDMLIAGQFDTEIAEIQKIRNATNSQPTSVQ